MYHKYINVLITRLTSVSGRFLHSATLRSNYFVIRNGNEVLSCICLFACLSVRLHISEFTRPNFTNFVHVARGRCSVLSWRLSDTLCTSGFVGDVVFTHNEIFGVLCVSSRASIAAETTVSIPTTFCSTIKIRKYTRWPAHPGRSLLSTIFLLVTAID